MPRNEDLLLGRLAVQEGLCTPEDIDECLRMQSMRDPQPSLGDLLLFKGYLTAAQLKTLLDRQQKKTMACPACGLSFTVLTLTEGKNARCPRCKGALEPSATESASRPVAEITTQRMKVMSPAPSPATGDSRGRKAVCVVCDTAFQGAPDASGRLRCPSCQSTFTSRE